MRGAAVSGVFLLASWRVGFSLFLWIATIFFILLIFKCLKSLALAIKDQGTVYLGDPRGQLICRHTTPRSRRRSAWLAILGYDPPSAPGRHRDQIYTVRGQRSITRSERRAQRPRPATHQDVEYQPPNTPMQTPPLEPPPYSAITSQGGEEAPPAYDTLYPGKESHQGIPPV